MSVMIQDHPDIERAMRTGLRPGETKRAAKNECPVCGEAMSQKELDKYGKCYDCRLESAEIGYTHESGMEYISSDKDVNKKYWLSVLDVMGIYNDKSETANEKIIKILQNYVAMDEKRNSICKANISPSYKLFISVYGLHDIECFGTDESRRHDLRLYCLESDAEGYANWLAEKEMWVTASMGRRTVK